jgi:uncharacterized repeat protein (TIGR03803 family)
MRKNRFSLVLNSVLVTFALTIFSAAGLAADHERIVHNFGNKPRDGSLPCGSLIFDAAGNIYGTASSGGAFNQGMVFELTYVTGNVWVEKLLHSFSEKDEGGYSPCSSLIFDAYGNLYGTAYQGGTGAGGTLIELTPEASGGWSEQTLHTFNLNIKDGSGPYACPIFDSAGNLYGTTTEGGLYGYGSVYEFIPKVGGGWTEKLIHSFNIDSKDGNYPFAGLIIDAEGKLYGATSGGGVYNDGTAFELTPNSGGTWTEKILHNFNRNGEDGGQPYASLISDGEGNLYGTTSDGGPQDSGSVFELTPAANGVWTAKVLHNFGNEEDGKYPYGSVTIDTNGNVYGTTVSGGTDGGGVIFELTPTSNGKWTEILLHDFGSGTDGAQPQAGLVFDSFGSLYGTTSYGGTHDGGTIFEMRGH